MYSIDDSLENMNIPKHNGIENIYIKLKKNLEMHLQSIIMNSITAFLKTNDNYQFIRWTVKKSTSKPTAQYTTKSFHFQ